jgi:DNA-binding NtrC family response regulator
MQKEQQQIFIVDDDPFWSRVLTKILAELGYTNILCLDSATDCIDKMHYNPSVIFLDYQMEIMNGLEALEIIKNHYKSTGVVFCTAHENMQVAVDAIKGGSFDYLLKMNATKEEVANVLNNLFEAAIAAN